MARKSWSLANLWMLLTVDHIPLSWHCSIKTIQCWIQSEQNMKDDVFQTEWTLQQLLHILWTVILTAVVQTALKCKNISKQAITLEIANDSVIMSYQSFLAEVAQLICQCINFITQLQHLASPSWGQALCYLTSFARHQSSCCLACKQSVSILQYIGQSRDNLANNLDGANQIQMQTNCNTKNLNNSYKENY